MTDAPPGTPGHSNGTAFLRLRHGTADLFDVICPACEGQTVPYAPDPAQVRELAGPWDPETAGARLERHIGSNTWRARILD
jgi:hypothetical protein